MKYPVNLSHLIFVCITLLFAVAFLADIISVVNDPEKYRVPQHFTEDQLSYKSSSVQKYIFMDLMLIVLFLGMFVLGVLRVRNKLSIIWTYVYYLTYVLFIAGIVVGYINWSNSGFDH